MLKALISMLAGGLLLCVSAPAAAAASASVTLRSITFQLIDLDPADGITPAVTFATGSRWTAYGRALDTGTAGFDSFQHEGPLEAGVRLFDSAMSNAATQAQVSGDMRLGTGLIGAIASADLGGDGGAWSTLHGNLMLSGHTELVVTANVVASGATHLQQEFAGASYSLYLTSSSSGPSTSWANWAAYPRPGEDPIQDHAFSVDRMVSVRIRNAESARTSAVFDAYAGAGASSNRILVPEPASWLMLALGLASLRVCRKGLLRA